MTSSNMDSIDFNKILNNTLKIFFKDALRTAVTNPLQAVFFVKTLNWQKQAAKIRKQWETQGLHVPPIIVFSVTSQCNLHCKGCYHQTLRQKPNKDISDERLRKAIAEAKELGISFIVFGGGEPLMRPNILDIPKDYPEIMFLMFTNGLLINEAVLKKMNEKRNVIPLLSLEGYQTDTDERRGKGVYEILQTSIAKLKENGTFWGTSITLTRNNFDEVTDENFVKKLVNAGCRLFMLVEYTPVKEDTKDWVLTETQRLELVKRRDSFRKNYPAVFIALPWDEEEIGGCLSAGRGFIHISADGNVEPCPFIPYSDTNLNNVSLKEALQSKMLRTIRENHEQLEETHGCALWQKKEWVKSLAKPAD
ncbi:MAG TPA: radical SAM protein [Candidatus Bathyarchaeia archaeon]|nr:radical SAM protein [Candidatus Bathyarchaeia archaeon]